MSAPRLVAWRDIEAGSLVELKGKPWHVDRVKVKGKAAHVTVTSAAGTFTRELKAAALVELVDGHAEGGPLHDARGAQRRWATEAEAAAVTPAPRPEVGKGPRWDAPATDPAGVAVESILGARLVAETPDEAAGYFVPLLDVTTVRAHLTIYHGVAAHEQPADEARCLEAHRAAHESGEALVVNHWHSKRRPGAISAANS